MNKTELVEEVAKSTGLTKVQSTEAVEAVIGAIQGQLAQGGQVSLIGFGTFSVAERAARTGRNPQTGKKIKIAATRLPKFKPGKGLKDAVAKK
ncbi:MAG: HU family DNA-binding protein [Magnetococcales bacterium]|nr:HU family DNA-binding protein [Magnetococcales bacterium]